MAKYFSSDYLLGEFELFSPTHIAVLLILALLNVLMVCWQRRAERPSVRNGCRYALAAFLILQEVSYNLWHLANGTWSVGSTLPLHLCGAAILLSAVMPVGTAMPCTRSRTSGALAVRSRPC